MGIPACAAFYFFSRPMLGLFATEVEVVEYGMKIMKILASTYFICGIMDTISACLKGMNKSIHSMVSAVLGLIGVRILWIFTYFAAHRDLTVLYMSYPLSWTFVIIADIVIFSVCFRNLKRKNVQDILLNS